MEQYISDYRAPRTPAPIFPADKERDGETGKDGKERAGEFPTTKQTKGRISRKGETVDADWESWQERGAESHENAKTRRKFYREDDYNIGERQAGDLRRAQDNAKRRKGKVAVTEAAKEATDYPPSAIENKEYLTNWTGTYGNVWTAQAEQWRRDIAGIDAAWYHQQVEWNNYTETQRERTNKRTKSRRGRNRQSRTKKHGKQGQRRRS